MRTLKIRSPHPEEVSRVCRALGRAVKRHGALIGGGSAIFLESLPQSLRSFLLLDDERMSFHVGVVPFTSYLPGDLHSCLAAGDTERL